MWRWLQPQFLFKTMPAPWGGWHGWVSLAAWVAILALAWISYRISLKAEIKAVRRWWQQLTLWAVWSGSVGLILTFFIWQRLPFLSMRFWLALWVVIILVWLGWLAWKKIFILPKQITSAKVRREFLKYLPRSPK